MVAESQNAFRWDDARVLLALVREGTLSAAGARLGVNASTISRRLDALEEGLRARLFDRTPDGARPTAAAEQLFPLAEQMERAAMALAQASEARELRAEGEVRVSAPPGVAEHVLAPALVRLHARHPGIRVRLDSRVAYVDLTRREADLALRATRPSAGDLVAVKLGTSPEVIVASHERAKELGTLRDLGATPWITWDEDLAHLPVARWVAAHVPASAVVLRTSSIGAQLTAVASGLGVAWLPRPYVTYRDLAVVRLSKKLAALERPPDGSAWLVGHRALRDVPRIAAVWDWIVEEAASIGLDRP